MNILLTNDDGYHADGINFLEKYFTERGHTVYMVAPDREKSGAAHSMTFKDTIRLVKHSHNRWVLHGTPADCVHLGVLGVVPVKPDLVVSGINHGYNIGVDTIYSGTVGAARQGAIAGFPCMAFSSCYIGEKINFELITEFLDAHFEKLANTASSDFVINVNFPNLDTSEIAGVRKTVISEKHGYFDRLVTFDSPQQGRYYWIEGDKPDYDTDIATDSGAVRAGYISVSFIRVLPGTVDVPIQLG